AVTAADQLVGAFLFAVEDEPLRTVLEIGEDDRAAVVADDLFQPHEQRRIGLVDPDVDLTATRQPDAQREIVGDSVGEQLRLAAAQNLARCLVHLVLDAAAGDGARELAALGDRELRAHRPWGRPTRRDDSCERHTLALRAPALESRQEPPHWSKRSPGRLE